jgi:putative MATE family efflux protein
MAKNPKPSGQRSMSLVDESVPPIRTIAYLAWPVLLEQLLTSMTSYADQAMVGALGAYATAAVSISNPVIFLINGVIMAIGVSITALVARAIGAGDYDKAKRLIRHAVLLILCLGIPIAVLIGALHGQIPVWMGAKPEVAPFASDYVFFVSFGRPFMVTAFIFGAVMRGCGDAKTPMLINLGANILNIILNYFLINAAHTVTLLGLTFTCPGAGWGVSGAAIATSTAQIAGGVVFLLFTFLRKSPVQISVRDRYRFEVPLVRQIMSISWPAIAERVFMSTASIVTSRVIATLGTVAIAANSLYITAESIVFMPGFAFASAATTLVSQALGAKKPELAKKYVRISCFWTMGVMAAAGILLYVLSGWLISLFTPDPEVIALGAKCLKVTAFGEIPLILCQVLSGALRGAGDTRIVFVATAVGNWAFRTALSVVMVLVFHFGLPMVVFCSITDNLARVAILYKRYRSDKWIHAIRD